MVSFSSFGYIVLVLILLSACSTMGNRDETLENTGNLKAICVMGDCTNGKGRLNRLYQNKLFESQEGIFVKGKLQGEGRKTYYNADGSLDRIYAGGYKKGIFHGNMRATTYYKQQIATDLKTTYVDGQEEGAFFYRSYQQGQLVYEQKGVYKQGKKDGIEINVFYDQQGRRFQDIIKRYVNGQLIEE